MIQIDHQEMASTPRASDVESAGLVEQALREALPAGGRIAAAGAYHLASGGKRLRARLVLAGGALFSVARPAVIEAATACELVHQASLVHDDIQDGDAIRRGRESVWRRFGVGTAICLGDAMLSNAIARCARIEPFGPALAERLNRAVGEAAEGQALEAEQHAGRPCGADVYERLAAGKSGALLGVAGEAALVLAGRPDEAVDRVGEALRLWGVAYQIHDDMADVLGRKEGRAAGGDLRAGQANAVVICHLSEAEGRVDAAERRAWKRFLQRGATSEQPWLERLAASGSLERASRWASDCLDRGKRRLEGMEPELVALLEQRIASKLRRDGSAHRPKDMRRG